MQTTDPTACARCATLLAPLARFCHHCGQPRAKGLSLAVATSESGRIDDRTPVPASPALPALPAGASADFAERRFATCVFADIADYTAICGSCDPEHVQAMLRAFFAAGDRAVVTAGGHVIDHAGDAIVAVFGAPIARGDDALRGVRAAIALHRVAAELEDPRGGPLRLHVGCASGEVVTSSIDVGGHAKYTVTGEALNLAARLAGVARAGETVVSGACHRLAEHEVQAAQITGLRLKGLPAAQSAWRVEGLMGRRRDASTFVGRRAELAEMDALLETCRREGRGRVVRVEGEAGIGKSRFLAEACVRASAAGFAAHVVGFVDFGAVDERVQIVQLIHSLAPAQYREDAQACCEWAQQQLARRATRRAPDQALGTKPADGDADALLLAALLGAPLSEAGRATIGAMSYAFRRASTVQLLAALLDEVASGQPQLIAFEDMHWAPAPAALLLHRIAARVSRARCIFVFTSRDTPAPGGDPEPAFEAGADHEAVLRLRLAPLDPEDAMQLVAEFAGDHPTVADCVRRAQGNPLFLESLLRALVAGDPRDMPGGVQTTVASRVDRFDPTLRNLLQVASVLGVSFDLHRLEALLVADGTTTGVWGLLEALCHGGLLRRKGQAVEFTHALVHEAVYASLLHSRRRVLHRCAAELYDETQSRLRGEHLLRAADSRAGRVFLEAAMRAIDEHRPEMAAELADRGLASAPAHGISVRLSILRGNALREMGRTQDAATVLEAALAADADDALLDAARIARVEVYRVTGEHAQALLLLDDAERSVRRRGAMNDLARVHSLRGSLLFAQGRAKDCLAAHEAALGAARAAGDDREVVRALSGLGDAYYASGRFPESGEFYARAHELARTMGLARLALPAAAMLGRCHSYELRLDDARSVIESALAESVDSGLVHAEVVARAMLANVFIMRAGYVECLDVVERAIGPARAMGARRFEAVLLRAHGVALAGVGDRARALGALHEALEISRATGIEFNGPAVLGALACVTDDAHERELALAEGEAILDRAGQATSHIAFSRDAIEACLHARDWARARHYADRLDERFRGTPIPLVDLVVHAARLWSALGGSDPSMTPDTALELERLRARIAATGYRRLLTLWARTPEPGATQPLD